MSAYARYIFLALYSLFLRFEIFSFRDSPSLHVGTPSRCFCFFTWAAALSSSFYFAYCTNSICFGPLLYLFYLTQFPLLISFIHSSATSRFSPGATFHKINRYLIIIHTPIARPRSCFALTWGFGDFFFSSHFNSFFCSLLGTGIICIHLG